MKVYILLECVNGVIVLCMHAWDLLPQYKLAK